MATHCTNRKTHGSTEKAFEEAKKEEDLPNSRMFLGEKASLCWAG